MSLLAETEFALALLKESRVDESYVISPLSISLCLALLHSGAEGNTKKQIQKVLAGDASDDQLVEYYKNLSEEHLKSALLKIANRAFIGKGFDINQAYLDRIQNDYSAKAVALDFSKEEECRKEVNGFVDEATNGKIKGIDVDYKNAVAILVNAIYFDAEWGYFFDVGATKEETFYVKPGVTKKVPFMRHSQVYHDYVSTIDCKVLSMCYKEPIGEYDYNWDYKFSIILPRKGLFSKFRLAAFRKSLTPKKLQSLLESAKSDFMTVIIPKFKIEVETDLNKILKKLGITEIFDRDAKLDGIAKGVHVSEVKHKAFIEVDESGTRAAAVTWTGLKMSSGGPDPTPTEFKANRPFIYVLSHKNHVIFTGQYCGS